MDIKENEKTKTKENIKEKIKSIIELNTLPKKTDELTHEPKKTFEALCVRWRT